MADAATSAVAVDAQGPAPAVHSSETSEKPSEAQANGGAPSDNTGDEAKGEHVKSAEPAAAGEQSESAQGAPDEGTADSTPAPGGKDKKRKSTDGVPEHKSKKLNKKKSMPTLRLECKPGEFYWARLKGYPPWPSIICDEEMLPESLLASRPVSTARPDGSIRDDFKEGGKNAKERTFPVMFLYTNEFQWMVNTNLTPLDPEECSTPPTTKMAKNLLQAYQVAAENHSIDYFKQILQAWQAEEEAFRQQAEEAAAEADRLAAEKAARAEEESKANGGEKKSKKKASRKSKAADEDMEMDDTEAPKSSKKRKKGAESDTDTPKPKKTPKVTKLNAPKTPNGEASASKSAKPKKKVVTAPRVEDEDESKPQLSEAEKAAQREKAILYLRHRLQKGFLARDQAPQASEMPGMAEFFTQLETYKDLEPSIIRTTKIHKVLKAIVKLVFIPRDDEYNFKKRSSSMLETWNKRMEAEGDTVPQSAVEDKAPTNGTKAVSVEQTAADANGVKEPSTEARTGEEGALNKTETATEGEPIDDAVAEPPQVPVKQSVTLAKDGKDEDDEADVDVSMQTAPEEVSA